MKTYYRPTERRGKRVMYVSTDPEENRRQRRLTWLAMVVAGLILAWVCVVQFVLVLGESASVHSARSTAILSVEISARLFRG